MSTPITWLSGSITYDSIQIADSMQFDRYGYIVYFTLVRSFNGATLMQIIFADVSRIIYKRLLRNNIVIYIHETGVPDNTSEYSYNLLARMLSINNDIVEVDTQFYINVWQFAGLQLIEWIFGNLLSSATRARICDVMYA